MKFLNIAIAGIATASQALTCDAFTTIQGRKVPVVSSSLFSVEQKNEVESGTTCDTICEIPTDVESPSLQNQPNGGKILRSAVVTDSNGDFTTLDRQMGKGTSVVIFLRHMG